MSNWIILLVKFPHGTKYASVSGPATFTAVLDNELLGKDQEKPPDLMESAIRAGNWNRLISLLMS